NASARLVSQRHVVLVLVLEREVSRGREAGELPKVVDEMRLVEVAASGGDVRPIHLARWVDRLPYLLEALHTREELRRHSHTVPKPFDEAALGHANRVRDLRDRAGLRDRG